MAATERDLAAIEKAKKLNYIPWCEQYERMISGQLYDSFVPELKASRFKARQWCYHYNHDADVDIARDFDDLVSMKEKKLQEIIGHVGKGAFVEPPFTVDYGCNIRLGERAYMNFGCVILDCGLVEIGDRTMFGPGVAIYAATHEVEIQSRRHDIEYTGPVVIGNDCWIGANTIILPGVTIGKGCTIGASSVVTRSIPDWSVAMGSPARVVKKVTPVDDIPSGSAEGVSKP